MLEVYVDYVVCKQDKKGTKATIHLSTERGDKGVIKVKEKGVTWVKLMTKYLAKYANGFYSAKDNEFIVQSYGYYGSMQEYEPYHLNYCPEYIERAFTQFLGNVPGYAFGSWNPIYGDKIKCLWLADSYYYFDKENAYYISIAIYDAFGGFVDIYSDWFDGPNPNQCLLQAIKEADECFYYNLEDGYWDIRTDNDDVQGAYYDIDLDYDEEKVLAMTFSGDEG